MAFGAAWTGDERLERLAAQLVAHVRAQDERSDSRSADRSSHAIEALGQEMILLAQTLERRIVASEARSSAALDALEARLEAEISGVTQSLGAAELRSARALDEVAGQVSGAAERMEARQAEHTQDLSERLAQNEARIAALLEDTRRQFEARFGARPPGLAGFPDAHDDGRREIEAHPAEAAPIEALPPSSGSSDDLNGASFIPAPVTPARITRRASSGGRTAWMIVAVAACLGVGAAGLLLMGGARGTAAAVTAVAAPRPATTPPAAVAEALETPPATEAKVILPLASTRPHAQGAPASYADVVRGLEAGEGGAIGRLRSLAERGDAQAQTHLGTAYENGLFGIPRNKGEARRWTLRGAQGGDAAAMHNLGLFYFAGDGVTKDLPAAARWFRAAAERGVADSQYNLAMLYQAGTGVPRNLPEAYKWFSIAAQGGDDQARAEAKALEARLNPMQLDAATRSVQAFRHNRAGRGVTQS